jgi:uracil-DNA glycosylase family 4
LGSIGLNREDVYITNVVKDRPPDNRDPRSNEVRLYAPFLTRQIEIIQPKVLVALGRFAMDFILQEFDMDEQGQKISSLHGKMLKARASYGDIVIVPLYHPSVTFYSAGRRDVLEQDFQVLRQFV